MIPQRQQLSRRSPPSGGADDISEIRAEVGEWGSGPELAAAVGGRAQGVRESILFPVPRPTRGCWRVSTASTRCYRLKMQF